MEFTGEVKVKSPVIGYYQWKSKEQKREIYNKETKEKVVLDKLPKFVVLRQGWSVAGYCEHTNKSVWSNEVSSTTKDILNVRSGNLLLGNGIWSTIKENVESQGGKLQIVTTVLMDDGIYGICLKGSAIASMLDACKKHDINANTFEFSGVTSAKKGANTYYIPGLVSVGGIENMSDCIAAAKEVSSYYNKKADATEEHFEATVETEEEDDTWTDPKDAKKVDSDDLPF